MRQRVPNSRLLAAAAVIVLALVAPAPAGASLASELPAIVGASLEPWTAVQLADGRFPDYYRGDCAGGCGGYDEPMLAYAMLMNGQRTGNQRQLDAAFRAIGWTVSQPSRRGAFRNLAMASAYNFARTELAGDPRFEALKPAWKDWLRTLTPVWVGKDQSYNNKHLVDAVAVIELYRSRLRSNRRGAILARRRKYYRAAVDTVKRRAAAFARDYVTHVAGKRVVVMSDPPSNPIAYHALSAGMLARAINLLGRKASRRPRRLLTAMTRGSAALTAPDGDVSYTGRSQQQAWSLTLTAYAALSANRWSASSAAVNWALSERAIARLNSLYWGGPRGWSITPTLAQDPPYETRGVDYGLDGYASTPGYTALTMVSAQWAMDQAPRARPRILPSELPADRDSTAVMSGGAGVFTTVRRGSSWYAVRLSASGDLRMDFGIAAWKTQNPDGSWLDTLPLRPRGRGGAGPFLVRGDQIASPHAQTMRLMTGGAVGLEGGGFKAGRGYLQRTRFLVAPAADQLRYEFKARRGDRILYSVFLPAASGIAPLPNGLSSSRLRVEGSAPSTLSVDGRFASGREFGLVRATLDFSVQEPGVMRIWLTRS